MRFLSAHTANVRSSLITLFLWRGNHYSKGGRKPVFFLLPGNIRLSHINSQTPHKAVIWPVKRFCPVCGQFTDEAVKTPGNGKFRAYRGIPGSMFIQPNKLGVGVHIPTPFYYASMMSLSGNAAASAASFSRSSCVLTCGASATLFVSLIANQFLATKIAILGGVFPVRA